MCNCNFDVSHYEKGSSKRKIGGCQFFHRPLLATHFEIATSLMDNFVEGNFDQKLKFPAQNFKIHISMLYYAIHTIYELFINVVNKSHEQN